ncbi:MAG: hypothetical protein H6740_14020 [Alphaproteobacteria bacterium]|nr:hypothetical protein [Alphaproteobacteria bacterium]
MIPGCGVGRIDAVESMDVGGDAVQLYRITLEKDQARMWIPTHRAEAEGLRPVMSADRVKQTWEVISSREAPEKRANWNRRQRRYNEMLMSNKPLEMAEVLGELAAVRETKSLSFGERRIFERVRELLVGEIAAARGESREEIEARMESTLAVA